MKAGKSLVLLVCLSFVREPVLHAAEKSSVMSLSGQATSGNYSNSRERSGYSSGIVAVNFYKINEYAARLTLKRSNFEWKGGYGSIQTIEPGLSLTRWMDLSSGNLFGVTVAGNFVFSDDDPNSDGMIIPYVNLMAKNREGSRYLDVGYARSDYTDTTVNQITASYGFSFAHSRIWSRTRLYYLDLGDRPVEGMSNSTAVEQKLTWYMIPEKLSLTLTGLLGRRVHGYDPDIAAVYIQPDIQRRSGGVTLGYSVSRNLHLFADASYESYRKPSINDDYGITYATAGVIWVF